MIEFTIKTTDDILALSPEQFGRFLPDLVAWYELSKSAMETGLITGSVLRWLDDGKPGEIHSVDFVTQSGELIGTLEGPAFS